MDEAYGIHFFSISIAFLFYINDFKSPKEISTKLEEPFGKKYGLRGHHLKNEMITIHPFKFDSL